jgi:hypothetical protein
MIFSKSAIGKCLGCPVALSKLAVFIALPVPAIDQDALLSDGGASLGEGGVHLVVRGHVHAAEHAAQLGCEGLALLDVQVEKGHLHTVGGEAPRGGGAEA